jgi:hypothetical protein
VSLAGDADTVKAIDNPFTSRDGVGNDGSVFVTTASLTHLDSLAHQRGRRVL